MTTPPLPAAHNTGDAGHTADHNLIVTALEALQSLTGVLQSDYAALSASVAAIPSPGQPDLRYAGTPARGNLVFSAAATAGTDLLLNTYVPGITWYEPSAPVSGPGYSGYAAIQIGTAGIQVLLSPNPYGPWTANAAVPVPVLSRVAAVVGGTAETWHAVTSFGAGWAASGSGLNGLWYRLLPDGDLELAFDIRVSSAGAGGTICTLPAAYQVTGALPVRWEIRGTSGSRWLLQYAPATGQLTYSNQDSESGDFLTGVYPVPLQIT